MALITAHPTVELWQKYFAEFGYTFEAFTLNDSDYTRFIAPSGNTWLTQDAHISYPFLNATCQKISSNKDLAYELCEHEGITVPHTTTVTADTSDDILADLLKATPLVVKPHNASLSRGVTLGITDLASLKQAVASAMAYSDQVLVQEQIAGEEIRFVVVDGHVKAAILRQTPRVIGDGQHTVQQLLDQENEARADLKMEYLTYPQLDATLIDLASVDLQSVPANGEVVELGRSTMVRGGASIYNVLNEVHASYLAVAEKAAHALGARFVVVDVMIQDYSQPASVQNYAFIEFNTAPVFKLFYSCRDGQHFDALHAVGPMIDAAIQGAQS